MLKYWLIGIVIALSMGVNTAQATDIYRVLVPVDDQTTESREVGIEIAFSKMLIKLT